MKSFIFVCILSIFSVYGQVAVTFDNKQYEACTADSVEVTWNGYHNIQETTESGYSSCSTNAYIGAQVVGYYYSNHKQTVNIGASEGSTRYFVCGLHCSSNKKFKIYCSAADSSNEDPVVTTTETPPVVTTTTVLTPSSTTSPTTSTTKSPTTSTTTEEPKPSHAAYKSIHMLHGIIPLFFMLTICF